MQGNGSLGIFRSQDRTSSSYKEEISSLTWQTNVVNPDTRSVTPAWNLRSTIVRHCHHIKCIFSFSCIAFLWGWGCYLGYYRYWWGIWKHHSHTSVGFSHACNWKLRIMPINSDESLTWCDWKMNLASHIDAQPIIWIATIRKTSIIISVSLFSHDITHIICRWLCCAFIRIYCKFLVNPCGLFKDCIQSCFMSTAVIRLFIIYQMRYVDILIYNGNNKRGRNENYWSKVLWIIRA